MMLIQEPVHAAIWHCLNHYDFADATFLSERLFSEVGSDESLHLLATCYYRSGKISQAYNLLSSQGARTPQNKFLLAKCCSDLNKLSEAESLFPADWNRVGGNNSDDELVSQFGDSASFALQILAKIFAASERSSQASAADMRALKLNPFLWKSFESLCQRGECPDPASIFNLGSVDNLSHCQGFNPILQYANAVTLPSQFHQPVTTVTQHFQTHVNSASVTSTPLQQQQQPNVAKANVVESTPQLMMSMITPVHNQIESTTTGLDSCFTAMISGIGALNMSTDIESSNVIVGRIDRAPPPAPILGRRKRFPPLNSNITGNSFLNVTGKMVAPPILNWNKFLGLENSSGQNSGNNDGSFGVLPHGTLSWSNQGVRISQEPIEAARIGDAGRLDFSSLAVLSPFPGVVTQSQDGFMTSSTPAASVVSSPMPNANQSNINALVNSTNNEQKLSKRGLTENNSMKLNVFTPSSQNNLQFTTPLMTSATGVGSGQAAQPSANLSSGIQNVRRSSRLFVSSQQSKSKENSKGITAAPTKATRLLRSPSRKSSKTSATSTSNKISSTPSLDLAAEKNEKNKEKVKRDSSMLTPVNIAVGQANEQTAHIMTAQAIFIQRHCIEGLLSLMKQFGLAFVELSRFNCRKAIKLLDDVPAKHRRSCWVLGHLGKAQFELGEYKEAKRCFEEVRCIDPYRMEFMEYYSTALWHLQEEIELSALAQELTRLDKFAAQAWCAAGNCFSHQKEHENSIKFFNRAIQIDPNFAYAYTLLGHEYVMIEELEKALSCFRAAVRVDPRHYNAWYGIGLTYYKQERFQLAEFYYRKAMNINPQSPILMCHVAVVQHALQKTDRALSTLQLAIDAAPQNPLCKFEKASILFSSERYHEALQELNELKALAPKESPVYFLIGKVHNKLNNTHLALMHFSWAMDLDPKVANSQIKDALDPTLNRMSQDDPNAPASMDDQLVIEDIEVGTLEHTEDDAVMMEAEESHAEANADITPIGQALRASTPPAPGQNRHRVLLGGYMKRNKV